MSAFDPPSPSERPSVTLAGIGMRAVAQVLDGIIIGVPLFVLTLAMGISLTDENLTDSELLWITVLWVGVSLVYNTLGVALWGTTLGKRIAGLKVVNRVDGGPVSFNYAAVRALVPTVVQLVPAIGPGLAIVVYLRAVFHPMRQGLHDAAAGTLVVKR
ncbi:MAG: RDD family protein [Actinomycetota bacterium]